MRRISVLGLATLAGCTSYSPIPPECALDIEEISMNDDSFGFSGEDLAAWVGDSLSYRVAWEPVEGLTPLPDTLEIHLGAPTQAFRARPVQLAEGGCTPAGWQEHIGIVRPFTLTLGDAVVGQGDSHTPAWSPDRIELNFPPDSITISEEYQAAALAWLQSRWSTIETVHDFYVGGLFDLAAPTFGIGGYSEGTEPTVSGSHSVWRSASLVPAP